MSFNTISPGKDLPNDINVVIEIPAHTGPVKYEVDKDTGTLEVDRFLSTAMYYPCNYGYIPQTLSEDGDPADVLVVAPQPLLSGSVIRCRPIGVLGMTDESGGDAKVLAVPISKLTPMYDKIQTAEDFPPVLLQSITHFFEHYKDLEPSKWVKIEGWQGLEAARDEILSSVERYKAEVAA